MKAAAAALVAVAGALASLHAAELKPAVRRALMPRTEDYAHMWWAEGFPGHTPEAPWLRVVQTGRYAFALDTQTLRVPHFGAVSSGLGYAAAARADNRAWRSLPPAGLALAVTVEGKAYRCAAGGKWTNFAGPRLVESGRFLQRADVTDLVFEADDGARLNVEARFETVAWPDRLALLLAARLGGREAAPWLVERGVKAHGMETSTVDFVPPPGVARLEPGDFVEATFEHVIVPQAAEDYYGPNEALREALRKDADTWRMIHREAVGNDRNVTMTRGSLVGLFPAVRVRAVRDAAAFTLAGGLGYVPITVEGLSSPDGYTLRIDGRPVDQGVHGRDFWQADDDADSKRWSLTYTVPTYEGVRVFELSKDGVDVGQALRP